MQLPVSIQQLSSQGLFFLWQQRWEDTHQMIKQLGNLPSPTSAHGRLAGHLQARLYWREKNYRRSIELMEKTRQACGDHVLLLSDLASAYL
ncbi:MAG: hypothetical protein WCG27_06765, partial [Pseudomonadota bacterium]